MFFYSIGRQHKRFAAHFDNHHDVRHPEGQGHAGANVFVLEGIEGILSPTAKTNGGENLLVVLLKLGMIMNDVCPSFLRQVDEVAVAISYPQACFPSVPSYPSCAVFCAMEAPPSLYSVLRSMQRSPSQASARFGGVLIWRVAMSCRQIGRLANATKLMLGGLNVVFALHDE
jgi:hypothetical protein